MIKKIKTIALATALTVAASVIPVRAYELPKSFWNLSTSYESAASANNYSGIINYGVQIINLLSSEPENDTTLDNLAWKSYAVSKAYLVEGDYDNALKYAEIALPYLEKKEASGEDVYDAVYIMENYIKQLTPSLDVYTEASTSQKTYGVTNEPNGVLYGETSENMQSGESMVLLYLEYGKDSLNWAQSVLKNAKSQGKTVELALNFPNEGTTAKSVSSSDSWLSNLYSMLEDYSTVPIFLRIGAEMNVWTTKCTPDVYKSAFITIANKMRQLSNVSIVWSVAHTSTWKSNDFPYTADDYYPGDSYVDWVGVTCYTSKYLNGEIQDDEHKYNDLCYKVGYAADPVLMIEDIVKSYGDRKPIMISECGSAYKVAGSVNETDTSWAVEHLKQIYAFIPMVYPQVKLIAYFNENLGEVNSYDLDGSSTLKSAYNSITASDWFIHGKCTNSAQSFFKKAESSVSVTDSTAAFYAYPHLYGSDTVTVSYYLDGSLVQKTSEVPYRADISMSRGTHTLKVIAEGSSGAAETREYTVTSSAAAENADDFTDTTGLSTVQKSAVNYTVKNGIIAGYEDNTMRPWDAITRAEFATMICRFMGYSTNKSCTFSDASTHWASSYIAACVEVGAISGVGDNKFEPDEYITLAQAAKILTVVCNYASSSANYPYGFMAAADDCGMLNNLTVSDIDTYIPRIDVAMMIYNASQNGTAAAGTTASTASTTSTTSTASTASTATPTPATKSSEWSDWVTSLPKYVNSSDYDIESKTQYSGRTTITYTADSKQSNGTLVSTETTYGAWSDWSTTPVSSSSTCEVQTKEEVTSTKYHYAHYCTGASSSKPYSTSNWQFVSDAVYHDIGWFDSPLPNSSDSTSDYAYYVNGSLYRCSNTCYRWYLVEKQETKTTYYRYRTISYLYTYNITSSWSEYSDDVEKESSTREVRTRTVYRYKEK